MSNKKLDARQLDRIVKKMIETVDQSKAEIFRISEQSRKEHDRLIEELQQVKEEVKRVIHQTDNLEMKTKLARQRLFDVSKNFSHYSEAEIRQAYEKAHSLQMELTMAQEKEKQLRQRRDELERRLTAVKETIERADHLIGQVTVVLNYLNGDFRELSDFINGANEKQEFGLRIIEAQEEERKRLSREIHDGPAQMLANVIMRSDLIERIYRERGVEEAIGEMRDLKKMVRSALYEVRRIIYDLRPMALDDLGLIPTLKKYLQTIEEYHKTTITFTYTGEVKRLSNRFEVAVFRLVQEAVQNALKHAEATTIQVEMELKKDHLLIVVKDDGKGFNPNEKKDKAFGLMGMRERIEWLGGKLHIYSQLGRGTIVTMHIPLQKTAGKGEQQ
ncbi:MULTISPECIES: sensor histidine kinase [Anoxybacillus]|uniref:Signal transduction histidine-protein kinase/phosphatase DegS n=1 Tax=Anoxybacillus flavithermus TaxID=33934 RepID=A0A178TAP1_9BACL|nr:sensor histidine kinase [Anoxybacillus flavithermus]ASA96944.1 histidine kinase [Anoxybacillus flavithermus]ELK20794.1 two-component system signal transduction histidine kinase DegS [Anoxybacillus flavithermus TNO-09.006]MBE2905771.1 sensor histidine kinase [Anoxybacillus flavithermus]MBE2908333.1 sensor histidine kinase [Anoxybacillus flavithermus]MBE2911054.1 sensor histidine kinase [Anoxybacillus flavithermus]